MNMSSRARACGIAAVLSAFVLSVPVAAWNPEGHMVVAYIAFQHLNPAAKTSVGRLLKLNPQYASWMQGLPATATAERRALAALVHAADWPDFIKGAPGYELDGPNGGNTPPAGADASRNIGYADRKQHRYWHFVNVPLTDDGTPTIDPPAVNAQSEIELLRTALGAADTIDDIKSYDLAWLAHLVGDIHQPLHAVARFTQTDRDGDKGGNDVHLHCVAWLQCAANLHAEWDGLLGRNTQPAVIASVATGLDKGSAPAGENITEISAWISESVEAARTTAYTSTTGARLGDPDATVTSAYVTRARATARQRVRLAGRRLAVLINDALGH
jgi:hypothetical protein